MKWKLAIGMLFLSGALCNQGFAVEFLGHAIQSVGSKQIDPYGPCCSGPYGRCLPRCPDDYCPKTCPCFSLPPLCGCCDDYCPKRCPCFRLPSICGECDDYCSKKWPCIRWPCVYPDYYKCPPPTCQQAVPSDWPKDAVFCKATKGELFPGGRYRPLGTIGCRSSLAWRIGNLTEKPEPHQMT